MYAAIRAGGKQYKVAPGDVIRIEKTSPTSGDTDIEFSDVLAVSGSEGKIAKSGDARVVGQILGDGRGEKILVFHFKRKKQYKKLRGHRQDYTEVRINEISFDGETFKAEPLKPKKVKAPKEVVKTSGRIKPSALKATSEARKSAPKEEGNSQEDGR